MSEHESIQTLDEESLKKASIITVFDSKGTKLPFGDIYASSKTIVVFIRHFFCGMCQAYVSQLATVPAQALSDAGVKLAIVGCGDWELIDNYKKATLFGGDIYADPTRELYHKLGMTTETLAGTPKGEQKRSYVSNVFANVMKSIWKGPILNPHHMGKQGNLSQLGGDFVLGPGNACNFAILMKHTQDHIEVSELMQKAGVKF